MSDSFNRTAAMLVSGLVALIVIELIAQVGYACHGAAVRPPRTHRPRD